MIEVVIVNYQENYSWVHPQGAPYHLHIVTSLLLTSYVAHLNNVPLLERKPILSEIQVRSVFETCFETTSVVQSSKFSTFSLKS